MRAIQLLLTEDQYLAASELSHGRPEEWLSRLASTALVDLGALDDGAEALEQAEADPADWWRGEREA